MNYIERLNTDYRQPAYMFREVLIKAFEDIERQYGKFTQDLKELQKIPTELEIDGETHFFGNNSNYLFFQKEEGEIYGKFWINNSFYTFFYDVKNIKINKNKKVFYWKKL